MSSELTGKVAFVTGGASDVSKALARRLAAGKATVVLDRLGSRHEAEKARAEIEAAGGNAYVITPSVAGSDHVERVFDEIDNVFGGLDILVDNAADPALLAGETTAAAILEHAAGPLDRLACIRRAAPLMARRGGGSVVHISTLVDEHFAAADILSRGTAKAALETLTHNLAVELSAQRIRVNTAAVGMLAGEEIHFADELAELVAFLASSRASCVNGQVILGDGGFSTGHVLSSPVAGRDALHSARTLPTPPVACINDEIAIVGMGIAVPGANDPEEYWRELLHGADRFVETPADRWDNSTFSSDDRHAEDKTYSRQSAFITDFVAHPELARELAGRGESPAEQEYTTLWLRHSLLQAMEHVTRRPTDRFSFQAGYTADGSQHLEEATVLSGVLTRLEPILRDMRLPEHEREDGLARVRASLRRRYPRSGPDPIRFLPHRVGRRAADGILPPETEILLVDTACSSSLYAIDLGVKGLLAGRHDIAVCGGSMAVGPRGSVLFSKLNGLSVRGELRALDRDGDGVLFSDGAAIVVLKRLSRARADGDQVLATIKAFGSSSDGKGKAIYAPSAAGQKLAVRRAMDSSGMRDDRPDWIVAHATGTPAGDLAEFTTLREALGVGKPIVITSNKSVIGHTGWAAGAASLIHVVLALRHRMIPRQHRFVSLPADFAAEPTGLTVPTETVPWPPAAGSGRRRTASVSGFGFGGTNAHLIVQEPPNDRDIVKPGEPLLAPAERIAVVACATHLPGVGAVGVGDSWPHAGGSPGTSYGDVFPVPSLDEVRMPPATMRSIDRCQLMILQSAHVLRAALGSFWEENRATTGVVLGHMGATRNATLYATRCYLDDVARALRDEPVLAATPWLSDVLHKLTTSVKGMVPPSNEDTFPGMMPNVIASRVANYFDLHGLNMTVDTGFTSTVSAIDVASRYLRQGELSLALVGGINGNSTPEVADQVRSCLAEDTVLAEGAFLFALVTERTARESALDIIGYVDTAAPSAAPSARSVPQPRASSITCGARGRGRRACYLGAEGGMGLMEALATTHPGAEAIVTCTGESGATELRLHVTGAGLVPPGTAPDAPRVPVSFYDESIYDSVHPARVTRYVAGSTPDSGTADRDEMPFWPAYPCVVLTDQPELLAREDVPEGTLVLSTRPGARAGTGAAVEWLQDIGPASVRDVFERRDPSGRIRHVRLLTHLGQTTQGDDGGADRWTDLHDLLFLVVQQCRAALSGSPGGSCVGLLMGAMQSGAPRPIAGLFTGFFKAVHLEYPGCTMFVVVTSTDDVATAIAEARSESAMARPVPVAHYCAGERRRLTLIEEPCELLAPDCTRLGPESTVVAVGGGRGITAELMIELARHFHPKLYILGSNPLSTQPQHYLDMGDEEFAACRPDFILQQRRVNPGRTTGQISRDFDRIGETRRTLANLARMAEHSGRDRVHYITCDVTDASQVADAMGRILMAGDIDLLINAAGINRPALISTKDYGEFRRVRDLKFRGHRNLATALAEHRPKAWCNFGSLIGVTGQVGEADYASANDYLGTSATYSNLVKGHNEFTIGWTLWGEVGMGANRLNKGFLERRGHYSSISTAEGVHHFIRELHSSRTAPYTVHLGDAERAAITHLLPGFLSSRRRSYLGTVVDRGQDWVRYERVFDLDTDPYLRHHVVDAIPTLPGAFVTEIAVQAADALLPELKAFALEDMTFLRYLKVPEGRSMRKTIHARVVQRVPDAQRAVVAVRVSHDVVAPDGTVLVRDRPHYEVKVLMAAHLPAAPRWRPWHDAAETPVPDPYHVEGSPVFLTDIFKSTTDTRLHPQGPRATYNLSLPADHPTFSHFAVPVILIDGLMRTGALGPADGPLLPLAAPLGIGRIDLYEYANDCHIAQQHRTIDLYAMLSGAGATSSADGARAGAVNRFVAVRPDGRVLLQLKDLDWTVVGYLNRETGAFVTPAEAIESGISRAGVGTRDHRSRE